MDPRALVHAIDTEGAIAFLAEMVRFRSYSATPGETELARHMVARMRDLGMQAELQEVAGGRHNAIGRLPGAGGGESLLFNGHLDTNPATSGWSVDPWGGIHDQRFVYGIGVSNMKAGDAAYYWALKTLVDAGVRLAGDVVLTYVVGELEGGIGTVRAMQSGLRADHFVNAEPTDLAGLTLHAGSLHFEIEIEGVTRHLSKREEAVDAIAAACALVPRIDAMVFSGAEGEEHRSVNRGHVGVIHGALGPELHDWRPPQVADFVRLRGSARYAPSQSEEGALDDLRALLSALEHERPGLATRVRRLGDAARPSMGPFEVPRDARIVEVMSRAHREVRGSEQALGPVRPYCFYGTDAAHLSRLGGMPGIVCGPGGRYNTMPDERVDVPDYLDAIRIYLLAILDVCAVA